MCADFRFHPVGHGLFYSGVIYGSVMGGRPFAFVYDCGGMGAANLFDDFWNQYTDGIDNVRLDMLVVSHFHQDHIGGVPELIKRSKPRSIVLPYLYPEEKIAYVASLFVESDLEDGTGGSEELGRFILDPETFCRSYCKNDDCQIYYVYPDEKNGAQPEDQQTHAINAEESDFLDAKPIDGKHNVFAAESGSVGRIAGWKFCFFMPKEASFSEKFKNWMKDEGITDAQFMWGPSLDELFKKVRNKFKEFSSSINPNVSNLVCMHGPALSTHWRCWVAWSRSTRLSDCVIGLWPRIRLALHRIMHGDDCGWSRIGAANMQVLTGDAEFSKMMPNEIGRLGPGKCFLFQIPHHGSKNNWRDWFVRGFPNCRMLPVTHNANCRHRGKAFMTSRSNLVNACHVTEQTASVLDVQMIMGNYPIVCFRGSACWFDR